MAKETFERMLQVTLTPDELIAFGNQLSADELRRKQIEDELKAHNETVKAELKELSKTILETSESIKNKSVHRAIECHYEMDKPKLIKHIVRNDTGEIVSTEPMTQDELQRPLFATDDIKTEVRLLKM